MGLDALTLGPPIPHTAAFISASTTSATKNSTDAADYTTTGSGAATIDMNGTNTMCPRYVCIINLDSSINLIVTVGNTLEIPPTPTSSGGGDVVLPSSKAYFAIPSGGLLRGVGGTVKVVSASGTPSYGICWYP